MEIGKECLIRLHECTEIQETGFFLYLKINCRLRRSPLTFPCTYLSLYIHTYTHTYELCLYMLNKICTRTLILWDFSHD